MTGTQGKMADFIFYFKFFQFKKMNQVYHDFNPTAVAAWFMSGQHDVTDTCKLY